MGIQELTAVVLFCLLCLTGILQFLSLLALQPLLGFRAPILPLLWPAFNISYQCDFGFILLGLLAPLPWVSIPRMAGELCVPDRVLLPRVLADSLRLVEVGWAVCSQQTQEGLQVWC